MTTSAVAEPKVRVRRRRVRVYATSSLRDTAGLAAQVETAVTERISALSPLRPLRVRATVQKKRD